MKRVYLLLAFALICISSFVSATSGSSNFLNLGDSVTLSPIGTGITSASVETYNTTWLNFTGISSIVQIDEANNFSQPYSISFWFRNFNNQSAAKYLINKYSSTFGRSFTTQTNSGNDLWFEHFHNSSNSTSFTESRWDNFVENGLWYQIVAEWNGTATLLYGNRALRDSDVATADKGPTFDGTANVTFGNAQTNLGYFNGSIDEVRIYNRTVALWEVKDLYDKSQLGGGQKFRIIQLSYHQIRDDLNVDTVVNTTNFDAQMGYLNSTNASVISFEDYYNYKNGNLELTKDAVIIVFDDGFINVMTNAKPIMDKYGYTGSLGIISNSVGADSTRLSWENITTMYNAGWEVLSHSINGTQLTAMTQADYITALTQSKANIIANISVTPITFVYPGNAHNSTIDAQCALLYSMCTGDANSLNVPLPIYKNSNLIGGLNRTAVLNDSTIEQFKVATNKNYLLAGDWELNENNGTTAYDSSGFGNNGSLLNNASYQNDGILVEVVGYALNTATGLLTLPPELLYNWIETSWEYVGESYVCTSGDRSTLNLILIVGALMVLLPFLFIYAQAQGDFTEMIDMINIKFLIVTFIIIAVGLAFLITSAQNIDMVCAA